MKKTSLQRLVGLCIVSALVLAGVYVIGKSGASGAFVRAEPELGTLAAPAAGTSDTTASGGKTVRFATSSTVEGGCSNGGTAAPCIGGSATAASGWGSPVFTDEFSGSTLNTSKWAPCWYPESFTGDRCGMMNDSTTDKRNVTVSNGAAVLTQAARDSGALINSDPDAGAGTGFLMNFVGYAEARVYFPGSGSTIYNFPAWWINGPDDGYEDGEIDVAEGLGTMTTNYHYDRGSGHIANNSNTVPGAWSNSWHTYGVHRKATENIVYFDGVEIRRYPTYDSLAPQSLIFNVGTKESRTMVYGAASQVKIDYVRVWR